MSDVALLDVNLLVALFDPYHVHHDLAHDWFGDERASGWATCPLTENGLIRVLCHPAYDCGISRPADLAGHRQVSDIYLLGLAKKHGGRLATFDRGIPLGAVVGEPRNESSWLAALI